MAEQAGRSQKNAAHDDFEVELEAIRAIIAALSPLSEDARASVISYVFRKLAMSVRDVEHERAQPEPVRDSARLTPPSRTEVVDIRTLKEEKQPSSAREMAVLVAYYLSELAPDAERKEEISADDIRQYFKQGAFRLPASPEMTLVHTRNAGYLDSGSARGLYKLNAVGYNLIVHSLPAGPEAAKPRRRKREAGGKKRAS
jgi:hypothetical protein